MCKKSLRCAMIFSCHMRLFFAVKRVWRGNAGKSVFGIEKYMILEGEMRKIGKRLLATALAAALTGMPVVTAMAEEIKDGTAAVTSDDPEAAREAEREAGYKIQPDTNGLEGWPEGPAVYADSAIVMDMNSGAVLYGKQTDVKHYPASITKLMTELVALENSELTDEVLFSDESIAFLEPGDASIGMRSGEILSMEDAMYGMLLASANEVSYAIAENVGRIMGGDYDTFIQTMNDRAAEIGCTNSHWMNANGLHDPQHYTTAHDMAVIASEVYQFEEFRKIVQTLSYTIGPTNLVDEERIFQQNHKMLWPENENYYEYCTGGKTGYTDQARTTLVTMADNGDLQLAAVVLYDFGNDAYVDTRAMFDYAFDNFERVSLSDQEKPEEIEAYTDMDSYVVLPTDADFADLEREIEITDEQSHTGVVTYTYQGQNVGSADVVLTREYVAGAASEEGTIQVSENTAEEEPLPLIAEVIINVAVVVVVLFIVLFSVLKYRKFQRRRRLRSRRRRKGAGRNLAQTSKKNTRQRSSTDRSSQRKKKK